jgi:hypothetical protein
MFRRYNDVRNPAIWTAGKLAGTAEVSKSMESPHGRKYVLDGRIESPSGKAPVVRTIWIVDRGQDTPRLWTAYPHEE